MPTVIRDDSIGQALGALGGALMSDPKSQWEAYAYKQRIAGMQAENAQKQLELQNMRAQQSAQQGLIGQINSTFQPGNFNIPAEIETPRPTPSFSGPMPGMDNPADDNLDKKLAFARAAATNAIMRGGNPNDALSAAYASLGMGNVYAGGVPTNELDARTTQTMLTGQIPDAKVALTEDQRRLNVAETEAAKLKEAIPINENGTLLTPDQARVMNVPADANGQFIVRPPADPNAAGTTTGTTTGPLQGNAIEAQAANILFNYQNMVRSNQPVPPEVEAQAQWAWNTLYGPKREVRSGPGGALDDVTVYPATPGGFTPPGAGQPVSPPPAQGPVPTGPRGPQAGWVPSPQAQPGQPVMVVDGSGTAVRRIRQGTPEMPAEHLVKKGQYLQVMDQSLQQMIEMLNGGYQPTFSGSMLSRLANSASEQDGIMDFAIQLGAAKARGTVDPAGQQFEANMMTFLNAILRDESGAAVPISEYPKYIAALIPRYGDDEQTVAVKRQKMAMAVEARRRGMTIDGIQSIIMGGNPAADAVSAQPGGAGTVPPPPVENDRVRLRQEADAAIAQIDASNLPSSEKERRKAAIMARFNQMIGGQ
jgi:hypothetical protein